MSRKLSAAEAKAAFDELAKELPKQHLRLQFRKRFGTGELLGPETLKRGTATAERAKPVTNLLQEVPEQLHCTRLVGTADDVRGDSWTTAPAVPIGDLLSPEEVEQGLIVQGRRARLYAYADPTEDIVYVFRVVTEAFGEEEKGAKPKERQVHPARRASVKRGRSAPAKGRRRR